MRRTPEGNSWNIDSTHSYDHGYHSADSLCPGKGVFGGMEVELQQQLVVGPTLIYHAQATAVWGQWGALLALPLWVLGYWIADLFPIQPVGIMFL